MRSAFIIFSSHGTSVVSLSSLTGLMEGNQRATQGLADTMGHGRSCVNMDRSRTTPASCREQSRQWPSRQTCRASRVWATARWGYCPLGKRITPNAFAMCVSPRARQAVSPRRAADQALNTGKHSLNRAVCLLRGDGMRPHHRPHFRLCCGRPPKQGKIAARPPGHPLRMKPARNKGCSTHPLITFGNTSVHNEVSPRLRASVYFNREQR